MKYPRTLHIRGSLGKQEPEQVPLEELPGSLVVVEEKLDGTQLSIRFEGPGQMVFQSRGTVLSGAQFGPEFNKFKPWVYAHSNALYERLGSRFTLYGEWLYAKHTVFYDALPHYFLEFDLWDREEERWLSTARRRELLEGSPVVSVPVLYEGPVDGLDLDGLIAPSLYKTEDWKAAFREACRSGHADYKLAKEQTAWDEFSEGLYLKSETDDYTVGRYKYIRPAFLTAILDSGSHWKDRPTIANQIREGVDLFAPVPYSS